MSSSSTIPKPKPPRIGNPNPAFHSHAHSLLPLPRALRQNRSFAQLARLIGLTSDAKAPSDSDSEDGDESDSGHVRDDPVDDADDDGDDTHSDVDEGSLMWDAQASNRAVALALVLTLYRPPSSHTNLRLQPSTMQLQPSRRTLLPLPVWLSVIFLSADQAWLNPTPRPHLLRAASRRSMTLNPRRRPRGSLPSSGPLPPLPPPP